MWFIIEIYMIMKNSKFKRMITLGSGEDRLWDREGRYTGLQLYIPSKHECLLHYFIYPFILEVTTKGSDMLK